MVLPDASACTLWGGMRSCVKIMTEVGSCSASPPHVFRPDRYGREWAILCRANAHGSLIMDRWSGREDDDEAPRGPQGRVARLGIGAFVKTDSGASLPGAISR